jgi:hypothetical protein
MTTAPLSSRPSFQLPSGPGADRAPATEARPSGPARHVAQSAPAPPDAGVPGREEITMLVRATVETMRGYRSPYSLSDRVVPEILAMLARRAELGRRLRAEVGRARPDRRMQVSGVRVCPVSDRAVEASAVVREPGRARAVALRMERLRSGWRVVALELG